MALVLYRGTAMIARAANPSFQRPALVCVCAIALVAGCSESVTPAPAVDTRVVDLTAAQPETDTQTPTNAVTTPPVDTSLVSGLIMIFDSGAAAESAERPLSELAHTVPHHGPWRYDLHALLDPGLGHALSEANADRAVALDPIWSTAFGMDR